MYSLSSGWGTFPLWLIRKAARTLWAVILGALLIAVLLLVHYIRTLPELSTWHTTFLQNEFTAHSQVKDFKGYLALEDRLFSELNDRVYAKLPPSERNQINRYTAGSFSDPKRWAKNWNRSFELPAAHPKVGVLFLHGMSDSPYIFHSEAKKLNEKGAWVVAMRLPGHGTLPSGLVKVKWQDMKAVVKIGMQRLRQEVGDAPIYIVGFSTGGLLALNYTLSSLDDPTLPSPSGLVLFSPAVGVSKAAALAVWQSRLGLLFGIPGLEWNSIAPEYDPFKYNSFAINAADQVYRLSQVVQEQIDAYVAGGGNNPFPPILGFASIVDNTVSVPDIIHNLYERLPKGKNTFVLFDINNNFKANHLIRHSVAETLQQLRDTLPNDRYTFELISNRDSEENTLLNITNGGAAEDLHLRWPKGLYSLSHMAITIDGNDPLYGGPSAPKGPGLQLGHLALYGESNVLQISDAAILRQRWNPFYCYVEQRVLAFTGLQ